MAVGTIIGRVSIKVIPDTSKFRKELTKDLNEIERRIGDLSVQLNPEFSEKSKEKIKRDLEQLKHDLSGKQVELQAKLQEAARREAQAQLAFLARTRFVDYVPRVSKTAAAKTLTTLNALAGGRVVSNMLSDFKTFFSTLDKKVPIIASLAEAIAGLGAWGLSASSNLFSLSAGLASISGLLIPLPALLGSMITSFITLGMAFDGFGAAVKKGGESLAALPPQMRAAAVAVRGFKVDKTALQERFWNGLAGSIDQFRVRVWPAFRQGLNDTATALNGFAKSLLTALNTVPQKVYSNIFENFTNSIAIAADSLDPLINAFGTLGLVGTSYMDDLARSVVRTSKKFDKFIQTNFDNGKLQEWTDNAVFQLKALGHVAGGIGRILHGLSTAAEAAGGSTLKSLGDTLDRVQKKVNGPKFQRLLTGVFAASAQAMDNLTNKAGPAFSSFMARLARTLTKVLPIVGNTLGTAFKAIFKGLDQPQVQKGVIALFEGIRKGVQGLAPAIPAVGRGLGAIATVIGTLASNLGPVLGEVLTALADAAVKLAPALTPVIDALSGVFLSVLKAIEPILPKITDALVFLLNKIAEHPKIAFGLAAGFVAMGWAFSAISAALGPLLPLLGPLVTALVPALSEGLIALAPFLVPIVATFASFALIMGTLALGFFNALKNSQPLRDTLNDLWTNVLVPMGKEIWTQAKENWPAIKQAFIDLRDVATQFWIDVQPALQSFVDFLKDNMPFIKGVISAGFKALGVVIKGVAISLSDLVWAMDNSVKTITAFGDLLGRIRGQITGFSAEASGNGGGSKGMLFFPGVSIIQSLMNGIVSKTSGPGSTLQSTLAWVTSMIPKWKGPLGTDQTLLTGAGVAIMDGFIGGLESRYSAVRSSLGRLTSDIGGMDMGSLTADSGARIDAALAGGSGATTVHKTLKYYAAPGSSIDAEEDLFAATERARMVGW